VLAGGGGPGDEKMEGKSRRCSFLFLEANDDCDGSIIICVICVVSKEFVAKKDIIEIILTISWNLNIFEFYLTVRWRCIHIFNVSRAIYLSNNT
jgi:hypothetical protein